MTTRDIVALVLLAALWGASFLFQRVAAPEFGPVLLVEIRVAIAAVVLGALLARRRGFRQMYGHAASLAIVGALNSAIPFSLFAYATLWVTAGFAAVLNATVPLFGALVAYVWFRERLAPKRAIGLAVGFTGVVVLVWTELRAPGGARPIAAGLVATGLYATAAHYTKARLSTLDPLTIAAGSMIGASVLLLPAAVVNLPAHPPSGRAWLCALALGVGSTGVAYALYFRLIASVGPGKALMVTYLIPAFGMLWGALVLNEPVTAAMVSGCVAIVGGTMLSARG